MKSLKIEPTENSPKVYFILENNFFEISGESRPENVRKFYEPIMNWLDELVNFLSSSKFMSTDKRPLTFNFKFEYFNSPSAKLIVEMLKKIKEPYSKGVQVKINWYYEEDNDEMRRTGEEFSKIIGIPFEYIEVEA